jgi:hypothetical protein
MTGNSMKYMQEMMGYDEVQSSLIMKLFRNKLVHLAMVNGYYIGIIC